jgi:hypothetical protein
MNHLQTASDLSNLNTTFVSGKKLAALLGVSTSALSDAIKHGHHCARQPVCQWADLSETGRVKGYHMPHALLKERPETSEQINQPQKQAARTNPASMQLDSKVSSGKPAGQASNGETNDSEPSPQPAANVNKSVLPQGQDYSRTAGMITLPQVLKKALEKDTPQNRVVITLTSGALGATIGGAATNSAAGTAIGAGIGLVASWGTYWFFGRQKQAPRLPQLANPRTQVGPNAQTSRFINNAPPAEFTYI